MARGTPDPFPVAVIGAGFSGTLAALQILARAPDRPVLLFERGGTFGRGLAYGTGDPAHLLNVRAANMSAFPDRPGDFVEWLVRIAADLPPGERAGICRTPAGTFAARGLYGRYLASLLARAGPGLSLVPEAVIDLEPVAGGFALHTEGGGIHRVCGAVLALGNLAGSGVASRHRVSPWTPEGLDRLDPGVPVLIVGTGLTMVDAVATLRRGGFPGPVVALSRRGLVPSAHAASAAWPPPDLGAERTSLVRLLVRVRAEIAAARRAGTDWRGVIDALRPVTDRLWNELPEPDRARFLRHLRPFWDVHRHRSAPPAAAAIADEIARGSLTLRAGRIVGIEDEPDHARVTWRARGERGARTLRVQCLIDATGVGPVGATRDPLLRRLIARGLVRPGPFGLGLDATVEYRVRSRDERDAPALWTLGPLLRGVLWECTAVPDIRVAAERLAGSVTRDRV